MDLKTSRKCSVPIKPGTGAGRQAGSHTFGDLFEHHLGGATADGLNAGVA